MWMQCPACRKETEAGVGAACPRCGCDLGGLCTVVAAAARRLHDAAGSLRRQRWEEALECASRSWELYHSPEAARVAFVAACSLTDSASCSLWWPRTR